MPAQQDRDIRTGGKDFRTPGVQPLSLDRALTTGAELAKPALRAPRTFADGLLHAWQIGNKDKKEVIPGNIRQSAVAVIEGQPDGSTRLGLFNHTVKTTELTSEADPDQIVTKLQQLSDENDLKILATAIAGANGHEKALRSKIWFKLDSYPIHLDMNDTIDADQDFPEHIGDENERRLFGHALRAARNFAEDESLIVNVDPKTLEVHPLQLTTWEDQERVHPAEDIAAVEVLAEVVGPQPINNYSATPVGGGVEIMLADQLAAANAFNEKRVEEGKEPLLNIHWYVMTGQLDPQAAEKYGVDPSTNPFFTTKKLHIINHGQTDQPFTKGDENTVHALTETNVKKLIEPLSDPAAVQILHDAQVAEYFQHANPDALRFWRLHIALRPDLIAQRNSAQESGWMFLKRALTDGEGRTPDLIQVHPSRDPYISEFLPTGEAALDPRTVVHRSATMAPTGELGKPLSDIDRKHYLAKFDQILERPVEVPVTEGSQETFTVTQKPLNPNRRYAGGIHRFDEMKNIPGELESYLIHRQQMRDAGLDHLAYGLLIAGQVAFDDTSGQKLYEETLRTVYTDERFTEFRKDIQIGRLPNNKRMLNALGELIDVDETISWEEGCEVKASEELEKGKVVIGAYRGGIPRQLRHGINSFIVEPDDHEGIAGHLTTLATEPETYARMSQAAKETVNSEYKTMADLRDWLGLIALQRSGRFAQVMESQRRILGRQPFAKELVMAEYGDQIRQRLEEKERVHMLTQLPPSADIFIASSAQSVI